MIKPRVKALYLLLLREANIVITSLTAIAILYLRSAHSLWFGAGALVCTVTAKILKRLLRQPRPIESTKKSFGMPSTHSSSITYFGIYLLLVCLLLPIHQKLTRLLPGSGGLEAISSASEVETTTSGQVRNNQKDEFSSWADRLKGNYYSVEDPPSFLNIFLRLLYGTTFMMISVVVCWSRIKFGHHTYKQVVTGATIGALIGAIWFGIWNGFKIPKVMLLQHFYYHASSSSTPLSSTVDRSELITIKGIGPYAEDTFNRISILFAEAWYMRDFGLIWDGLIRPTINQFGFYIGLRDRIFNNGLPPHSHLHLVNPHPDSPLQN
ncbi:hypothetical protein MJO29_004202 [Puccinia striiformis f. sp. tritici]|uniref:Phosphatidic acid phosphatase type 2/haloperoxidase domain-containing protein n=1 Tax=Puccinia striiformis TaxID=27350 RepID=A0A2S4WGE8_9BASI|nr:hypothetical protein Pst134EA_007288 [Puccinia striiformis f. sp. tritici]KAH9460253.1 hypothetical protein Pst134EB_008438 [Puccinia striiformis f. sp. tritici]KAH9470024.1 hypothetical protein Pst134EA_007288 [Puccinia striiformis f. sp. tritici]KAI7963775.1 hypothetical protein MJO29_004202 [Puccinia striiformis f. sp. tritici]POW20788.1 hypothetical protein PSHT_03202 [Puccinia striiformis]